MLEKTYHFLVNPTCGVKNAISIARDAVSVFNKLGRKTKLHIIPKAGSERDLVGVIQPNENNILIVFGGDGTLHQVVNALLLDFPHDQQPIGIMPTGSGNDLANELRLFSPKIALHKILTGNSKAIDVIQVDNDHETRYMLVCLLWGYSYDLAKRCEQLRFLPRWRYILAGYIEVPLARAKHLKIIFDEHEIDDLLRMFVVVNSTCAGGGILLAPTAKIHDGLSNITLMRDMKWIDFFKRLLKIKNKKINQVNEVEYYQAKKIELITDNGEPIILDGDYVMSTPVKLVVLPSKINIFC